ncbi:glycoside hydrolase [Mytilinidion resinicola]|uniref:glucan 1,3-beta-glucosidase n=1 Tax=Mytilinidion resinicola TaxID=574789 RepID=A0A6A6YUJ6_9PEZI|nr:glycoside hydrolase [Mytilinidion resinicola]KAF2811704.1 glycoside hydrolase [Mytilinidion resinicola]
MAPDLFDGTDAIDQFTFDQTDDANSRLKEHWESYFTEDHVSELASYGINAIRIPVGFWAYDNKNTPYLKGADAYLDRAVQWARVNDMKVWVDLHGAPGSQNGFDHSGQKGSVHWQTPKNLDRTITVLKKIAQKYGSNKYADVVSGIELLNEPTLWGKNELLITKEWTQQACEEVRDTIENKNLQIVVQDGFKGSATWVDVVKDVIEDLNEDPSEHHSDFAIDSHLYQLYKLKEMAMDQPQHIIQACNWRYNFEAAQRSHIPVYVGEWSGATKICVDSNGTTTAGETCDTDGCQCIATTPVEEWNDLVIDQVRRYIEAQLDVWEANTKGWFYWNFKGTGAWGFMDGIEKGFIPNPVTSRKYPGQCDATSY